jgi:hypothetical protein
MGSIICGAGVSLGSGASAAGGVVSNAVVQGDQLSSFNVTFPPAGFSVQLEPDRTLRLAPGSYGAVQIKSRSAVFLQAGDYYFSSLTVEPGAVLSLPSAGKARIFVQSGFVFRGRVARPAGGTAALLVAYLGTSNALLESSFRGSVIAPNAKIVLASVEHVGSFFGKRLEVQAGARLRYAPFPGSWQPGMP